MPNTREKLIEVKKALAMCYKQGITSECKECAYRECNNVCMDALMKDALAVINYLEDKQLATDNNVGHKWIPVTERLPEMFKSVLGYDLEKGRNVFWYDEKGFNDVDEYGHTYPIKTVTHWMPLPEPPKEVE